MSQGRLLTTAETSELLHAPESTLRYWRSTGRGPVAIRVGRRVLYDERDVEAWIDELRKEASTIGAVS